MASIVLKNADAVIGQQLHEGMSIAVSEGTIDGIGRAVDIVADEHDCTGLTVLPGFIDVHIHGALGVDVNAAEADGLLEVARCLATQGVTSWMPTLVPDSDANYARVVASIDKLMQIQRDQPVAQALGV